MYWMCVQRSNCLFTDIFICNLRSVGPKSIEAIRKKSKGKNKQTEGGRAERNRVDRNLCYWPLFAADFQSFLASYVESSNEQTPSEKKLRKFCNRFISLFLFSLLFVFVVALLTCLLLLLCVCSAGRWCEWSNDDEFSISMTEWRKMLMKFMPYSKWNERNREFWRARYYIVRMDAAV